MKVRYDSFNLYSWISVSLQENLNFKKSTL